MTQLDTGYYGLWLLYYINEYLIDAEHIVYINNKVLTVKDRIADMTGKKKLLVLYIILAGSRPSLGSVTMKAIILTYSTVLRKGGNSLPCQIS